MEKKVMVPLDNRCLGKKVAKDVCSHDGTLLLGEGTMVTSSAMDLLNHWLISQLWIYEKQESVEDVFQASIQEVEKLYQDVRSGKNLDQPEVYRTVNKMVETVLDEGRNILSLSQIRMFDEYTFQHSVNVCVFSTLMGKELALSKPALISLGTAALLHDVGKCFVPLEIVNKQGPLDSEELKVMRTHPFKGYRYLQEQGYPDEICLSAYEHHETADGRGYPLGISVEKTLLFSRIIALADFYDALTTDRPYRSRVNPLDTLEIMKGLVGKAFSLEMFKVFLRGLELFPKGTWLLLHKGIKLQVVEVDEEFRPVFYINETPVAYDKIASQIIDIQL